VAAIIFIENVTTTYIPETLGKLSGHQQAVKNLLSLRFLWTPKSRSHGTGILACDPAIAVNKKFQFLYTPHLQIILLNFIFYDAAKF
jgi:hypothetical protein